MTRSSSHAPSFPLIVLTVAAYGVAMAYLEAAVVVYLDGALGQRIGELFPLLPPPVAGPLPIIEAGREAATLVMLAAIGLLAGRTRLERLAWTAVAFGTWDIAYYAWLRLFTGWPPDLGTWDVLFVVPVPWIGPVWAPVVVSVALIGFGLLAANREWRGGPLRLSAGHVAAALAGGLLVIVSFTLDAPRIVAGGLPGTFPWPVFVAGIALAGGAAVDALRAPRASRERGAG